MDQRANSLLAQRHVAFHISDHRLQQRNDSVFTGVAQCFGGFDRVGTGERRCQQLEIPVGQNQACRLHAGRVVRILDRDLEQLRVPVFDIEVADQFDELWRAFRRLQHLLQRLFEFRIGVDLFRTEPG